MKKIFLFLFLLVNTLIYGQAASKLNNAQNTYSSGQPRSIISCDTLPSGLFRSYPKASVTWNWSQILSTPTTLGGYGIVNGVPNTRTINGYNLSTDITLSKVDIGLGNVDNTSDLDKPISTATQTALDTKQSILVSGTNIKTVETQSLVGSGNIDLNKSDVGLGNVDNTSDLNKPISTATQTALDTKQATLVSGTNIKTIEGQSLVGSGNVDLTKSDLGLSNVDNTSDLNKPISTATQTALNGKLSAEVDGSVTNEIQTLSITGNSLSISSGNSVNLPIPVDYTNTVAVAGGAGNAVFYLTSDKTSTGTALYTNVTYVSPIVNDSTVNYTYGWSYNAGTKALTVNVKQATGINVALLSLTLLQTPNNVANGTSVQVLIKGN